MKTSVIEVGGMLSALSALGAEKRLARLAGVKKIEVNYVSGSATVVYDETVTDLNTIKARVHACGYHCSGELAPKHVCEPEDPPAQAAALPDALHAGHGAGMDMNEMARDMRNRFFICLAFAVPIFVYSPMGGFFTPPAPPFGLGLNLWLFILATIAVIYPSWPFFVAARRHLAVSGGPVAAQHPVSRRPAPARQQYARARAGRPAAAARFRLRDLARRAPLRTPGELRAAANHRVGK